MIAIASILKPLIGPAVNKALELIPNRNERERAKEELEQSILQAAVQANDMQNQVNLAEAQHKSRFVAGWRPGIGWVCALGIGMHFVLRPLLNWSLLVIRALQTGQDIPLLPPLEIQELIGLVGGMLGLGTIRMAEKMRGVSREVDPRK